MTTPREVLDKLDSRHDELIRKLDELNAEIEATLAQFARSRTAAPPDAPSAESPADDVSIRRAA
jgi:hypothetical protein